MLEQYYDYAYMKRFMPPKTQLHWKGRMNVNAVERAKLLDFDARLKKKKKDAKMKSLICIINDQTCEYNYD